MGEDSQGKNYVMKNRRASYEWEWIDFRNGKFVDLSMSPWDEEDIRADWELSNRPNIMADYSDHPKGSYYNWTDRAIAAAKIIWGT